MPEAWELTADDSRSEDNIETYIIFCEDQNDEPCYFRSFEIEQTLKVNCIPNQKKGKLNLANTLAYCQDMGILDFDDEEGYRIKAGSTQNIWCVYDRDSENIDFSKIRQQDNISFDSAIIEANRAGIQVAWSNDAFELWVLLHFEKVSASTFLHRDIIYEKLTSIFRIESSISSRFESSINSGQFSYKQSLKKRSIFVQYVLPILRDRTNTAIENSQALEIEFGSKTEFHKRNPCSMVHGLVSKLIEIQT